MSSSSPLTALPPVPDGVNPYAYYLAIADSVVYRRPLDLTGFKARLIVLFCLLAYLVLCAGAYLAVEEVVLVEDGAKGEGEIYRRKVSFFPSPFPPFSATLTSLETANNSSNRSSLS
jgi:hypothetical protein